MGWVLREHFEEYIGQFLLFSEPDEYLSITSIIDLELGKNMEKGYVCVKGDT